ncbi:MAG: 23S rRNA (pseudouridine(1915)-N(3))-methyltransferase RlmH [Parasporobacterium sp.]|nr:23S rRNA (pseudouridine(1915)-N(3))-methyltransferase RlmH [Parasporobacterium sp.]
MVTRIIAVGKLKESYLTEAAQEYIKRLGPYTRLEMIQIPDEKCPEGAPESLIRQVKEKEGRKILDNLSDREYVITLEIKGKRMTSEAFAGHLEELRTTGRPDITFVIGGSVGLSPEVSDRADLKLSFSDMTFPHQLMRIILLEQIYRSFKIARHEPYHK